MKASLIVMAVSGIFNKVTFVSKLPLLMKATSTDPAPPAGHIYNEIIRITFESLEQSDVLVEFLVERLKKNSPYVKWKVLLIMKAVLANGHEEFRHSLSKQYHGIREAKSYSGRSDPLHGDSPYINVREVAGEVLQLLFDTDWTQNSSTKSDVSGKVKVEGFGSSNFGGSQGSSRQDLNISQAAKSPSSKDGNLFSYAVQRVKDNIEYVLNENISAVSKYQQLEHREISNRKYYQFCDADRKVVSVPSKTLGIFANSSSNQTKDFHEFPEKQNSYGFNELQLADDSKATSEDSRNRPQSPKDTSISNGADDRSPEEYAVEKITALGERQNLGRSELQEFTRQCEVLNFERIVDLIGKKLECSDHVVQMRTLVVVESLLHRGIPGAQELFESRLVSRIEALGASSQKSVKNKAKKLLHILRPQQIIPDVGQSIPLAEQQGQDTQLVDLLSDLTVSNPCDSKVQPKKNVADDQLDGLLIDVTLQGNGESKTAQKFEDPNGSNTSDMLSSLESKNQKSEVDKCAISNSYNLLNLDPFSGIDSTVSNDQSQPASFCNTSTANNASYTADGNMSIDPFSVDSLSIQRAEGVANDTRAALNSGFDFLLFDNKPMENSAVEHAQHTIIPSYYAVQPELSQPTMYQQCSAEKRQLSPQFHITNQQRTVANHIMTSSSGSSVPLSASPATTTVGAMGLNRPRATGNNGFDFMISGKKASPFDFVREEMEASKKK